MNKGPGSNLLAPEKGRGSNFPCTRLTRALLLSSVALAPATAAALPGDRAGAEFQVNTRADGSQSSPAVARDATGNSVIVWSSSGGDPGVFGQRYDRRGEALGEPFAIGAGQTLAPAVAMDDTGGFVVAWSRVEGRSILGFARRYDRAGFPAGAEFALAATPVRAGVAVALDADGDFAIAWSAPQDGSDEVFAQRFDRNGAPRAGAFIVNQSPAGIQRLGGIAMDRFGEFVVAWSSDGSGDADVFARRFDPVAGAGDEFRVNTTLGGDQSDPDVARGRDGAFVVAWRDEATGRTTLRRFDGSATPQGGEVLASTSPAQFAPSVAMDRDGDFVVAWHSLDALRPEVFGQRFDATGAPQGLEFQVNTFTADSQALADVAMDATGGFTVTWQGRAPDGASFEVFAQRHEGYRAFAATLPDQNGNATPEIAGLAWNGRQWQARVRDGFTGAVLNVVSFSDGFDVADFVATADAGPRLAVLSRRPDTLATRVELRPLTGGFTAVAGAAGTPLRLLPVPDVNGNGTADFALLERTASGAVRTVVREGSTLAAVRTIGQSVNLLPVDLAVLPDVNGNGRPELAYLGQDANNGAVRVESRDTANGALVNSTDFNAYFTPTHLLVAPDSGGGPAPDLAVAGVDAVQEQVGVQVLDSVSDRIVGLLNYSLRGQIDGAAVLPDLDGNGKAEVALLLHDPLSARTVVEIRDADTDRFLARVPFTAGLLGAGLFVLDDYSSTGGPELGVLARRESDGFDRLQVRDSVTGGVVKSGPVP